MKSGNGKIVRFPWKIREELNHRCWIIHRPRGRGLVERAYAAAAGCAVKFPCRLMQPHMRRLTSPSPVQPIRTSRPVYYQQAVVQLSRIFHGNRTIFRFQLSCFPRPISSVPQSSFLPIASVIACKNFAQAADAIEARSSFISNPPSHPSRIHSFTL